MNQVRVNTNLNFHKIFSLESLVLLYFLLLLFWGKTFTKFNIAGPIYLHDLFFFCLALIAINTRRKLVLRFHAVTFIIILSIFYLLISIFYATKGERDILLIFRHFYLFFYLMLSFIIFNVIIRKAGDVNGAIKLLMIIAKVSILLQIVFIVIGYFFIPGFGLFGADEYNYFSPLVIFGIIGYAAYILAYENNRFKRYLKFMGCLFLSTTLGHSSAFLAVFLLLLIHFFIKITPIQRLIAIALLLIIMAPLFFLPQFTDANAGWRVLYWKHVLERLINEKYLIFGYGFGQPYMTSEYGVYLNEVLNSPIMMDDKYPLARYLSPPHNSILTIAFHIGLIPMLFLFIPLKNYFKQLFFKPITDDQNFNFLIYNLTGCIVWVCFNVILELPHSAVYFWLVFFTTALYSKHINTNLNRN